MTDLLAKFAPSAHPHLATTDTIDVKAVSLSGYNEQDGEEIRRGTVRYPQRITRARAFLMSALEVRSRKRHDEICEG